MKSSVHILLLIGMCLLQAPALAWTADQQGPDSRSDAQDGAATEAVPSDFEVDKCNQVPEPDKLPERVRSGVHEFACRTFRWFDGLFGDEHDFIEEEVGGKMSLGLSWNEFEHSDARMRFRVRTDLPNFSNRWDAFFGRVDEEAYVSDTETIEESRFRRGLSGRDQSEWLLGLGYRDRSSSGDGWDYSVGIRLRTPPRAYVKARYYKTITFRPELDLHYRQTVFWRDGTGFGTTTYLDTANELSDTDVMRWEAIATLTEETDGTEWWAGHTWYHQMGHRRGVSLLTFVRGITGSPVSLHEYGFELTFRRQVARDWLYFNFGPTLTWPRELPEQERSASWGFFAEMEFEFGHQRG